MKDIKVDDNKGSWIRLGEKKNFIKVSSASVVKINLLMNNNVKIVHGVLMAMPNNAQTTAQLHSSHTLVK